MGFGRIPFKIFFLGLNPQIEPPCGCLQRRLTGIRCWKWFLHNTAYSIWVMGLIGLFFFNPTTNYKARMPERDLGSEMPESLAGRESTCNAGDPPSSIPRSGRSPGEGIDYPLQYWACGSAGKESACNRALIHGLGRSPGEGKGYPLKYSGLENSMDCIVHRVTKSQTRLSMHGVAWSICKI